MKYTPLIIIAIGLLLAGCGEGNTGPDNQQPFIGGNVGLNMYLQNGLPPPEVFDGGEGPFTIGVVLENVGEYDIDATPTGEDYLAVRLEGLLPTNFGITEDDLIFATPDEPFNILFKGAEKNFDGTELPGDVQNVIWPTLSYQPDMPGNQVHTFRISACYDYKTQATALLCMKNEILENVQDSTLCTLTGEKPVMNSGAPLHVTHVTENPMDENVIQVNFDIEHVGTGEFYGDVDMPGIDALNETCQPSITNTNKYKVHVNVTTDDGSTVTCYRLGSSNAGVLTMYQGAPQKVTCRVDGSESNARVYQTSMNIVLSYRYGEFIEDSFTILAVPHEN